jgi:sRNA-binding protein
MVPNCNFREKKKKKEKRKKKKEKRKKKKEKRKKKKEKRKKKKEKRKRKIKRKTSKMAFLREKTSLTSGDGVRRAKSTSTNATVCLFY